MSNGPLSNSVKHEPPRTAVEFQIAKIWQDILAHGPIGIHDDFFQLGGTSLQATELVLRFEKDLNRRLSISSVFENPTIATLAATLTDDDPKSWSPLVPMQPNGDKPPIFCLHPGTGNVFCYRALADRLDDQQPFYALEAPGTDGVREPVCDVESLATEHLTAIRRVQPDGPYALAGYSFGGVVAFEIAQQLQRDGQKVAMLAIIDAGIVYAFALMRAWLPASDNVFTHFSQLTVDDLFSYFREKAELANFIPSNATEQQARWIVEVFRASIIATFDYRPSSYSGKIAVLATEDPGVHPRHRPGREWSRLCESVDVVNLPGSHLSILNPPHVDDLAVALTATAKAVK